MIAAGSRSHNQYNLFFPDNRKIKLCFVNFCIRLIWPLFKPAAVLNPEPLNPEQ
jgi:hypothetical protein